MDYLDKIDQFAGILAKYTSLIPETQKGSINMILESRELFNRLFAFRESILIEHLPEEHIAPGNDPNPPKDKEH